MSTETSANSLESRIQELETQITALRSELVDAQLEQWEGRIDDLELQIHLGSMEANDRVMAMVRDLRHRWEQSRAQVSGAAGTTSEVLDTLRAGLESAMKDVRDALVKARETVTH